MRSAALAAEVRGRPSSAFFRRLFKRAAKHRFEMRL